MAVTYIGTAAIFGVDGTLTAGAVITAANFTMTDASMTDAFEVFEHKDGEGHTTGASASAREQTATFTIIPVSVTAAGDTGNGEPNPGEELNAVRNNIDLPTPLSTIVIAGFGTGVSTDKINPFRGNWAYVGGQITPAQGGLISMRINCERYNDAPDTQTLFGA